ncbi:NADPH oxidase organizer 1a [Austrofundulus limnaeus]|uniref:NADPH oxidase organizer 1a n=1 Tax=Austrofundulus limnaeus TaxID=52670 RepID=A0A2I4BRK3_AUSLI|nr:PREDICTED: NADPH oxidase organizer 1-like [Austrofundulus limnaeus]
MTTELYPISVRLDGVLHKEKAKMYMTTELYPISVRLDGVLHKEKAKMYMTAVLWSDQNEVVVYRSFEDFKDLHKQLKAAFPSASKRKKSDRILPKFKGIKMKMSRSKRSSKSLVRLKYLQKYCNELLSCDPRVSQSADLIQFFQAKDQELQPEFTKGGIIIVPSEDEIRSDGGHSSSGGGNVTQPFVTETYRCVASYETKDTKNKTFKASAEEKLDVLIKDKGGWWLVENENKQMAWFPAPYLVMVEDEEIEDDEETPKRGTLYTAVKSYKSTNVDEISVNMGTVVEVLQKTENGWWLIRHDGKIGYIPALHLKPYSYPHIRLAPEIQDLSNSSSPSLHHSRSFENLPQLSPVTSLSPDLTQGEHIQRSRSLSVLPEPPHAQVEGPSNSERNPPTKPTKPERAPLPPPPVTVQDKEESSPPPPVIVNEEGSGWMLTADSDSFESDSFSDDSDSGGSSFKLSHGANDERLRLSRTPPPTTTNLLSPTSQPQGSLLPSVSDPNLYKGPASPKVPPRPRAQEIMSRCSSVTRKNAAKKAEINLPPTLTEVTSR